MGLHLIIDGYNLIRSSPGLSREEAKGLEEGRAALIERLAAYRRIKPWPITVVFDAAEGPGLGEKTEQVRGIKIVYSPAGRTADQVIIRKARKKGSQALVVTSDQALARAVEAAGAAALSSPEFEARMEMAHYFETKGAGAEEEDFAPSLSTRKKGPSRRPPRALRRKKARLNKI